MVIEPSKAGIFRFGISGLIEIQYTVKKTRHTLTSWSVLRIKAKNIVSYSNHYLSWLTIVFRTVFPQQCKLMGSSAQNSSGVHWCRRRVRFSEVPEKVPKVPKKVWGALVQSQVRFNRCRRRFWRKVPEKVGEALVQSQVRFNRVPEKVPGSFSVKPSQVRFI